MNPFVRVLAGLIVAAGIAAITFRPALATTVGSFVARTAHPSVTYVACRRTYHCHLETKDDGRKIRRCHVCG
jgi:hypothetical protein